ncbi:aminotransferase class IV [Clostridium sp. DJ247]|uniref:aminotransferase class IV n=1 Tax=Clostridium sp. DJ247 TaxID=2726188 RepID=UPI0016242108|nr:aminotransferase class IV [Clostridium sp. DJ247]MBC2581029.1 aminotransferase class IV [Clostridium sp. DJ247]
MILINGHNGESKSLELDSGLYFGRGLFETMMVKDRPIFLKEHLDRINSGLETIGINTKIHEDIVMNAIKTMGCKDCVLKLVVTEKNIIFTTRKNNYTEQQYKKGFKVKISSYRRNEYSQITYLKSLNYLENILEHEKCINEGYNEVLFLNTKNKLTEGSISNVFFVKNSKIYTPALECGLLDGTLRKFVLNNFKVVEGSFTKEDLVCADAVFLTNSVMGIMRVSSLYEKKYDFCEIIEEVAQEYEKQLKII